jgi:PAS fold
MFLAKLFSSGLRSAHHGARPPSLEPLGFDRRWARENSADRKDLSRARHSGPPSDEDQWLARSPGLAAPPIPIRDERGIPSDYYSRASADRRIGDASTIDGRAESNEFQSIVASGAPGEMEARLRRFDGEYRWFLIRAVPFRDETGTIIYWYGSSTDIQDRKRAEEKKSPASSNPARSANESLRTMPGSSIQRSRAHAERF